MNRDWRRDAACRGANPDIFFPSAPGGGPAIYREARTYCDRCEVRRECLDDALGDEPRSTGGGYIGWRHGMRGGLTPRQRAATAAGRVKFPAPLPAPVSIRESIVA